MIWAWVSIEEKMVDTSVFSLSVHLGSHIVWYSNAPPLLIIGTGKTRMVLTYLVGRFLAGTMNRALIIAPKSVLRSWQGEAKKLFPNHIGVNVISSELSLSQRRRLLSQKTQLAITTYGLVRTSSSDFERFEFVATDEGHTIKNHNSEINQACHRLARSNKSQRLLLTGTPILNKLEELWTLLDWATSGRVLSKLASFQAYFGKPIQAARDKDASQHVLVRAQRVNQELQQRIGPYILQRSKQDHLSDLLPPKTEMVVWTHLSELQRTLYSDYLQDAVVANILRGTVNSPLQAVTHLKKLAGHPNLVQPDQQACNTKEILEQSSKLQVLVHLVDTLAPKHGILIFSQSTKMLDLIQMVLTKVKLLRIDGKTPEQDRQRFVDQFNKGKADVMLLSTKAAGVGLTLTGADRVIVYDPSWTPAEDAQAVDRAYRIGQTKPVIVYRLITAGTVEEKMYEKQIHKSGIVKTVLEESESVQRYFSQHDLRNLFTLSPIGVCTVMDKVESHGAMDWKSHDYVLHHNGVVVRVIAAHLWMLCLSLTRSIRFSRACLVTMAFIIPQRRVRVCLTEISSSKDLEY
jgi:SNF2 family DNA or RNA helicase